MDSFKDYFYGNERLTHEYVNHLKPEEKWGIICGHTFIIPASECLPKVMHGNIYMYIYIHTLFLDLPPIC